jgi:hypothetical protein
MQDKNIHTDTEETKIMRFKKEAGEVGDVKAVPCCLVHSLQDYNNASLREILMNFLRDEE